jgi:hypothetical protein
MSRSATTFEQDFEKIKERARDHILLEEDARRLILLLHKNKLKKLNNRNKDEIKRLVQLGVVNLYMDNTITLSNLGEILVTVIKKIKSSRIN